MAELHFFHGPMHAGKSTLALQIDHNQRAAGRRGVLFTRDEREDGRIASRIGLSRAAEPVTDGLDFRADVAGRRAAGRRIDYLIGDEAQFYSPDQIEQLAVLVDEDDVDVFAFGLLTDFTTRLFPGSQRLVELADQRTELPAGVWCWCGARGTHNARIVDGRVARTGARVMIGDLDDGDVAYRVLCRRHHRAGRPGVRSAPADVRNPA